MQSMENSKTNSDQVIFTCTSNLGIPKIVLDKEANESQADIIPGITGASTRQRQIRFSKSLPNAQEIDQAVEER